jgi:hypothetical protein
MPYKCFLVERTGVPDRKEEFSFSDGGKGTRTIHEFRRADTGETKWLVGPWQEDAFGIGSMWFTPQPWIKYPDQAQYRDWDNDDGQHLHVLTPGGTWDVDQRCSNCGLPNERTHRCWVRHGVPPNVHVDKSGNTCSAGAGSIVCGNYHGFLHNGYLTDGC